MRVSSAGSRPAGYVHPMAIEVMSEIGIDISGNESKSLENLTTTVTKNPCSRSSSTHLEL